MINRANLDVQMNRLHQNWVEFWETFAQFTAMFAKYAFYIIFIVREPVNDGAEHYMRKITTNGGSVITLF